MEKTYLYKVYADNVYSGLLDNVTSKFNVMREINSPGSQIEIEVGVTIQDASPELDTDRLVDESAVVIVDDLGNEIFTRADYLLGELPNLNDRIEIWEISKEHPTGVLVFNGLVFKWDGAYKRDSVKITVISYGIQLDNYIVSILPQSVLQEDTLIDSSDGLSAPPAKGTAGTYQKVAQTFQLGGAADVESVFVYLGNPSGISVSCNVSIVEGTPSSPGSVLATVNRSIPFNFTPVSTQFTFSTAVPLLGSTTYHILVENAGVGSQTLAFGYDSTASYASGAMYKYVDTTGWDSPANDLGFSIVSASGSIGSQFLSTDPSDIMRELIDTFVALGGNLSYTDDSIDTTGTEVSYTFKFNTYMEAVKKVIELAPANWYWYVDSATGVVYMKEKGTEADHTLIFQEHIEDLSIEYSLENIKNKVYFTGGDTGSGVNLQEQYSNTASIDKYGNWIDLLTDNRVTLEPTAEIISQSILDEFSTPKFKVTVTVPYDKYDISTFDIGEMVEFRSFNTLIDSLLVQIMSINYSPYEATLVLDVLTPTQSKRIEDIRRNLNKQQTENNPDTV